MEDFKAKFEAADAENTALKQVLEQFQANKQAVEATIQELLAANINFKSAEILNSQKIAKMQNEIATLKAAVEKTEPAGELTDAA